MSKKETLSARELRERQNKATLQKERLTKGLNRSREKLIRKSTMIAKEVRNWKQEQRNNRLLTSSSEAKLKASRAGEIRSALQTNSHKSRQTLFVNNQLSAAAVRRSSLKHLKPIPEIKS